MSRMTIEYNDGAVEINTHGEGATLDDLIEASFLVLSHVLFHWMIDKSISQKDKQFLMEITFARLKDTAEEMFEAFLPGGTKAGLDEEEIKEMANQMRIAESN